MLLQCPRGKIQFGQNKQSLQIRQKLFNQNEIRYGFPQKLQTRSVL